VLAEQVEGDREAEGGEEDEEDADPDQPPGAHEMAEGADDEADDHHRHVGADRLREDVCGGHRLIIIAWVTEPQTPASVAEVKEALGRVGYLADEPAALVAYLAQRLGKPVLVEGPAGVGKTELAKATSRATERRLIRLQCYEGLDEAKALYEWNYRKQLLRIQAESQADPAARGESAASWDAVHEDIFSEEFLLTRPLLQAIAATEPVVLLIDEIDKTDQEFEAMLLEVLSDFQISIPELGVIEARTHPIVVLTSNNSRELTEALKRRCLYLWLDYPEVEREMEIVRLHSPEIDEQLARRLVEIVHMVRQLDLKKPPSIAESIDWARALLLLGADDLDRSVFERTMSIIVKHRTDMDLVAERVGMKLGAPGLGAEATS
jgi:MoxR-like ATPase